MCGANASFIDTELDLIRGEDAHKLYVRAEAEERVDADLRAELLPAQAMAAEVIALRKRDEVWIADVHHGAIDRAGHACNLNSARHHTGHTHAALDPPCCTVAVEHSAGTDAAVRPEGHLRSAFALSEPCSYAACSIAAQLSFAPVGVEEPQKERPVGLALQKLDPVSAHTRVPLTQPFRECRVFACSRALFDHEEVVAACVSFDKLQRTHSASTSGNETTWSVASLSRSCSNTARCSCLVAITEKVTRSIPAMLSRSKT